MADKFNRGVRMGVISILNGMADPYHPYMSDAQLKAWETCTKLIRDETKSVQFIMGYCQQAAIEAINQAEVRAIGAPRIEMLWESLQIAAIYNVVQLYISAYVG